MGHEIRRALELLANDVRRRAFVLGVSQSLRAPRIAGRDRIHARLQAAERISIQCVGYTIGKPFCLLLIELPLCTCTYPEFFFESCLKLNFGQVPPDY
jgi:hypothetical protein